MRQDIPGPGRWSSGGPSTVGCWASTRSVLPAGCLAAALPSLRLHKYNRYLPVVVVVVLAFPHLRELEENVQLFIPHLCMFFVVVFLSGD